MFGKIRENKRKDDRQIGRADIYLIAFFLLLALGSLAWLAVSREDSQTLRISYDGQRIVDVSLAQALVQNTAGEDKGEAHYCLLLYSEEGASCQWYRTRPDLPSLVLEGDSYNLLAVSGECVWMEAADCRDQICVNHRPITSGGESIICLPHRLVVEIVGGADSEIPDRMAKKESTSKIVPKEGRYDHETDS